MSLRAFFAGQLVLVAVLAGAALLGGVLETAQADDNALQQRLQRVEALAKANADYLTAENQIQDQQIRSMAARILQYEGFIDAMVKANPDWQKTWSGLPQRINWQSIPGNNQLNSSMGWSFGNIGTRLPRILAFIANAVFNRRPGSLRCRAPG